MLNVNVYNNKKRQGLNKYKDDSDGYVFFLLLFQEESNCPIDLDERTKSLNYLVYISKFG